MHGELGSAYFTSEETQLLTQTGPDTPMGTLFRRYWIPALLSEELAQPDGPPVRVKILSEDLVAFRDSSGRVGLLEPNCAHRGGNLFFGRNERNGIRCVYHGWQYDVNGQCIDQPTEPPARCFKDRIRLKSYPCRELGGMVWTYMGPPELMPELPQHEWAVAPESQRRRARKELQECNYLQAVEGGFDTAHLAFLHFGIDDGRNRPGGSATAFELVRSDTAPEVEVIDTEFGLWIAGRRNADEGHYYWRINAFVLPFFQLRAPGSHGYGGHAWVPIDDESCWVYSYYCHPTRPLTPEEKQEPMTAATLIPGTYRAQANKDNDYLIDRELQRTTSWTGIREVRVQDIAIQESMGPIYDRSKEHLGATDLGIIALRRCLLDAARMAEEGKTPPGVVPSSQRFRPASIILSRDLPFVQGAKESLKAGPDAPFAGL
jgi:phthalate 4,5-dioxygenase oxygenase subunit